MIDPKSCGCLSFFVLMIALVIFGIVGLIRFGISSISVLIPRITQNIPTTQKVMFNAGEMTSYPVLIEVPKEIRPGSDFVISIRGAEYQEFSESVTLTFGITTNDFSIIRQIEPSSVSIIPSGSDWLLKPLDIKVSTVNIDDPPDSFSVNIREDVSDDTQTATFMDDISIQVDRTPVPTIKIAQALVSLLAFIVGTFGTFIASKLF